jgi:hypothetical protein
MEKSSQETLQSYHNLVILDEGRITLETRQRLALKFKIKQYNAILSFRRRRNPRKKLDKDWHRTQERIGICNLNFGISFLLVAISCYPLVSFAPNPGTKRYRFYQG